MKALNEIEGLARLDILEQSGTPDTGVHAICGSVSRGPKSCESFLKYCFAVNVPQSRIAESLVLVCRVEQSVECERHAIGNTAATGATASNLLKN